jgi:acetolactate decarboxylase
MKKSILPWLAIFILLPYLVSAQQVHTVSEMRKVMMGQDLSAHLRWDTITRQHLFGISPLGRISGEITILDGQIFVSTVGENGQVQVHNHWEVEAPFGVYSHVPAWEPFDFEAKTITEGELQAALEARMQEAGIDLSKPIPFRLQGTFERIDYHIISKPADEAGHSHELNDKAKKFFSLKNTRGELLGFYSQHHEGVFTHRGSFVHLHFLDEKQQHTGHLENAVIGQKLTLLFPKRSTPTGSIRVNDTDFSKGRLGFQQNIELQDLVKFHGHLCDGLAEGYLALQTGLRALYPDGVADRTNTRSVSKPSPCLTDAAIYISGGRYQYNSFYVSSDFEGLFILQRVDNGRAVAVKRRPGVKPAIIDEMGDKAIAGQLSPCELDELRLLEDQYLDYLQSNDPKVMFEVVALEGFVWQPELKNDFSKTDILNKAVVKCEH